MDAERTVDADGSAPAIAALVEAARQGHRGSFDELVKLTYRETYTLARRLTGNDEDAADVLQEAYLRAWRSIGKFRGDAQFGTWLYRITANVAYSATEKRRRRRTESLEDSTDEPADLASSADPERSYESSELEDRLNAAVELLPTKLRAVVILRDIYGLSHEEIAKELGISVDAAKVRLHRARLRLRCELFAESQQSGDSIAGNSISNIPGRSADAV